MGSHNRLRPLQKAALLSLATTASALSLSNFQLITSAQVPLGCILTYNRPIPFCTNADFTRGNNGCSSNCADAIDRLQDMLQNVCGDGDGSSSSILGQAMQGTLVDVLCPNVSGGSPTTTSSSSTTSVITKLTLTTVVPPRTTTSSAERSSFTTSTTSSSTETPPLASDIPEPSAPQQPVPPQETTTTAVPSQTTPPAAPPNSNSGVGGGSPFDEPLLNASPRLDTGWMAMSLTVLAVGYGIGVLV
ncbi:hypothetical protein QBC37DRAFT_24445 [Rhypophila decipiens]|uniref:Uncharacterized protein n=1 Tax=Rhypophila decipiens TaxID=261697 RepID=A0AAN7B9S3_9PEZI|nr:hypothetical protein QBC37DRAFT_24445 [Rhypophila decipiens]